LSYQYIQCNGVIQNYGSPFMPPVSKKN